MTKCDLCEKPIRFWQEKTGIRNRHLSCFQAAIKGMEFQKELEKEAEKK